MNKFDFSIIRNLRKKWGITAEELARRANLTRATVAKIEGSDGNPTIETIEALSSVFQLTSSQLIRLAEVAHCEVATTKAFKTDRFEGAHIWSITSGPIPAFGRNQTHSVMKTLRRYAWCFQVGSR